MLGYILLACSLILGLLSGSDLPHLGAYFVEGLVAWPTIQLLGVVTLIEMLTIFLQVTGSLQRMLLALRRVLNDSRVLITVVPSVLGLLPVPGGAMLSAPMVGSYGDELGMDPDRKSAVNLFFRHIWDLVFPFKPHLILAATVFNVPLFTLIGWNLPVTLATVLVGLWYLVWRRPALAAPQQPVHAEVGEGRPLWVEVTPLALPLVLSLATGIDFLFAVAVGLLFGLLTQPISRALLEKMVRQGVQPRLLFILASVMIFKTVMEHSGLVRDLAMVLTGYGVPLAVLVLALPMAIGFGTGVEAAGVGIVFPLLVGLVPDGAAALPYMLMMLMANGVAQNVSPMHACLVMGNEYYGANLGRVVAMNMVPQAFRLTVGIAFAWALAVYLHP